MDGDGCRPATLLKQGRHSTAKSLQNIAELQNNGAMVPHRLHRPLSVLDILISGIHGQAALAAS